MKPIETFVVLFFVMFPLIVFTVHLKWGQSMKVFGYSDGKDIGLVIVGGIYILGIAALLLGWWVPACAFLIISCTTRPLVHFLSELPGIGYNRKYGKLNHGLHGKLLEEGALEHPPE